MQKKENPSPKIQFILKCSIIMLMLHYSINIAKASTYTQKPILISGKVMDNQGEPIAGASILIKELSRSLGTNTNGEFSTSVVSGNYNIEASHISYGSQYKLIKVEEGKNLEINFTLTEEGENLDDVIVTALGIKRQERKLGYAITKVAGEDISTNKTVNIQSALMGKVAGLDITEPATGMAGSKKTILRGISTISPTGNTSPLWIIDGVPINSGNFGINNDAGGGIDYGDGLSALNPDDIENISVLKGNAAAALYGSRASNGVIIVTTKSGKSIGNKGFGVDFNSSFSVASVRDLTNWQYVYGQGRDGLRPNSQQEALETGASTWGEKLDGKPTYQFDGVERPYNAEKNNVSNFYSVAPVLSNTLSISKNADNHNFRLSVGHTDNGDFVSSGSYKKRNAQVNASTRAGIFTAQLTSLYTKEDVKNRQFVGGNVKNANYTLTQIPTNINVLDMKPGYLPNGDELIFTNGAITNPYFVIDKVYEEDFKNRLVSSLSGRIDPVKGVFAQIKIMQDYYSFNRMNYQPEGMNWQPFGGEIRQRWTDFQELNYELTAGIEKDWNSRFSTNLIIGGNIRENQSKSVDLHGTPFVVPNVHTYNNTVTKTSSTSKSVSQINSLFGMAEFSFDRYLYLTLTGRNDWFSTLPASNNNLFYPSAALSFVYTDALNLNQNVFTYGKVRASFAQVSGGASPYSLDLSYGLDDKNYDGQVLQGISSTTIPNKLLKPLISTEYEFGLEGNLFNGLFSYDMAYYTKKIKDDIVSLNVSNASGFNRAVMNTGNIDNSGIEVMVSATPLKNKLKWTVTGTFAKNYNKVISLGDISSIQIGAAKNDVVTVNVEKDQPYGVIKGSVFKRDDQGNIVFDVDGYPMVGDRSTILGKGFHDKLASLSNAFQYNNFRFSFLIDAKFGGQLYSQTNRWATSAGKHYMTLAGRENGITGIGVKEDGKVNDIFVSPEKASSYYSRLTTIHEAFIYDASFIKLRELSLTYQFPQKWLKKLPVQNTSMSFVARNLFYLRNKVDNVAPESSVSSSNAQGLENSGYPETRTFGLNLNISF